ncbi:TolB family protein [Kutzneria sp. NPDC052558]|uniref:TolB family protein n=1 Tax=Kutzneria sp. NPDC052558 TaxID=3364121 RepID=UPI0037C687AD
MRRTLTVLAVLALAPAGLAQADPAPATTTLLSVATDGTAAGGSSLPAITPDGRYVAFASGAPNIVAGDTNRATDVFVRDRQTGVTTRVSVDSTGAQANDRSWAPSISADGRYVVFLSDATNLIASDTNRAQDVFLHDLVTGATSLVSRGWTGGWTGEQANSQSFHPVISADGDYIAFDSYASNIVSDDTNGVHDVFETERASGYTIRVSIDSNRFQGNGISQRPSISADGEYVAFESDASNIALFPDTNRATDVFVHDRLSGRTDRVSLNPDGTEGNRPSRYVAISADGRYFAYTSYASNLVPGDTNNSSDMFLFDRTRNTVTRISVGPNGQQRPGGTTPDILPSITPDGRYVAYETGGDDLVPGDVNYAWDVFRWDRDTATTSLISVATDGTQGDRSSVTPSISADGRHIAFVSYAHNWVPTGLPDNAISGNVFVRDLG